MFYPERPRTRPPKIFVDYLFGIVAIASMFYGCFLCMTSYSTLPDSIPIHFNASGAADGWGSKGMIWLLPLLTVIMVPGMLLLRRWPWISNVPFKITEKNAMYQYGLIVRLLGFLACIISLLFLSILYDTIRVANGISPMFLGVWFIPLVAGPIVGSLIWYFIAAFRGR